MLTIYYLFSLIFALSNYNTERNYTNNDITGTWLIVDNNTSTADYIMTFDNSGHIKYFSILHEDTSGDISINKNGNIAGTINCNSYILHFVGKFKDINCINCSITIPGEPKIEGVMYRTNKFNKKHNITASLTNQDNSSNQQLEIDNNGVVKNINHDIIGNMYIANNYFRCEILLNKNKITLKGNVNGNKLKGYSESGTNIITCNTIEISQ
ncbi:MAG: hypothetical protein N4A72_00400 [Bacteroidales bacterium]|jgi:hypothetical protein|nr:hypothetical protein [Bacteroidales bacterium]